MYMHSCVLLSECGCDGHKCCCYDNGDKRCDNGHPLVCVIETRDIKPSRQDGRASAYTVDAGC